MDWDQCGEALLLEIKNSSSAGTIFRESSEPIEILGKFWRDGEGKTFFDRFVIPYIQKFWFSPKNLEVDPEKSSPDVDLRKNLSFWKQLLQEFLTDLEDFPPDMLFSARMIELLRKLDLEARIKFSGENWTILSGLLVLRLVGPSFVNPREIVPGFAEKFPEGPSVHGLRAAVIFTKILQKVANAGDIAAHMRVFARFCPYWKSFFHRLMTGDRLAREVLPVTAEDLLVQSNYAAEPRKSMAELAEKQRESIDRLLSLDRTIDNWKKVSKKHNYYVQRVGNLEAVKCFFELNAPVELVYKLRKDLKMISTFNPSIYKTEELEKLSDNAYIIRQENNLPLLALRDSLFLHYDEMLAEDGFAIVVKASIQKPEYPLRKGFIRLEAFGGEIMRKLGPEKTLMTVIYIGDVKGFMSSLPPAFMKPALANYAKETETSCRKVIEGEYKKLKEGKTSKAES